MTNFSIRTATLAAVGVATLAVAGPALAQEKVLRVAHYGFNPQKGQFHMAFGQQATFPLMSFAESLTYVDEKSKTVPGLALSWQAKDKDTWVFKLRPNVRFQNGKPLTAEQVAKNVDLHINHDQVKTSIAANFLELSGAKVIDPLTVEITTKKPNPIFERWAAMFRIMDADYFKDVGNDGFTNAPIGTGAFRVTSWSNDRMEAVKFADAWRPAKVDRLIITSVPEVPTRVQALQSNQVDIAWQLSPDAIETLRAAGKEVVIAPNGELMTVKFINVPDRSTADLKPVLDARVRQAINYAVNRDDLVKNLQKGMTVAASQSATRTTLGFSPEIKPYPHDPERAKRLLAEAGHGGGLKLVSELIPTSTDYTDTMQFVAGDLKRVGIDLELRTITLPDILAKLRGQKKWDSHLWTGLVEPYPTEDAMRAFSTDSCAFFGKFLCDETIQPSIEAANQEFDAKKRAELVGRVLRHYHEQAWIMYMFERVQIDGISKNVRNYRHFNRAVNWHEIDLVRG
jgi:peptide/nickel transport system substrate-binding protein